MTYIRYTGTVQASFSNPDRDVSPGDVFQVDDRRVSSYTRRGDFEIVAPEADLSGEETEETTPTNKTPVKSKTAD